MSKSKAKQVAVEEEAPVITSLGLYQVPGLGSDSWVVLEVKTQGEKVISTTPLDTPNMKAIAQESFKIAVIKQIFK